MVSHNFGRLVSISAILREELESLSQDAKSSWSVGRKKRQGCGAAPRSSVKSRQTQNSPEICSKGYSTARVTPPPPPGRSRMLLPLCQQRRCLALLAEILPRKTGKADGIYHQLFHSLPSFTGPDIIPYVFTQLSLLSAAPDRAPQHAISPDLLPPSPPPVTMAPCFLSRKFV